MSGEILAASTAAASASAALIGTIANIIYQGRQLRGQGELLKQQTEVLKAQTNDLDYSSSERHIRQALSIRLDNWTSRIIPKVGEEFRLTIGSFSRESDASAIFSCVRVCNDSDRPIRNIQVRFDSAYAKQVRIDDDTITVPTPLSALGGNRSAWLDSDYQDSYAKSVTLRFTGADGRHWQINILGDVREIETRDW